MADDQENRHISIPPAGRKNGFRIPEDSLESAVDFLRGNARTTGEEPFALRKKAAVIQRRAVVEWAEASGLRLDPSGWKGLTTIGGSEHDIWESGGEIWKVTRPDHFGWIVLPGFDGVPELSEATPLEYLERWLQANRILGDRVMLRGISKTAEGVQVVVSQPFVVGPYPTKPAVRRELRRHGFLPVPGFSIGSETESSFYNEAAGLALFDAACDNFIHSQGVPIPVDVIVMEIRGKLEQQLGRLVHGAAGEGIS